jgi:hypothetical protein
VFSLVHRLIFTFDVRTNVMSRYLASLAFISCLSAASPAMAAAPMPKDRSASGTVAVHHVRATVPGLRDEAAMVLVGTALIGLAAAVRRAA